MLRRGFPGGSMVKNVPDNAGDAGLITGSERSPGEENGNPLQYSCLGNPMDRGAWWVTVHRAAKNQMQLTTHIYSGARLCIKSFTCVTSLILII